MSGHQQSSGSSAPRALWGVLAFICACTALLIALGIGLRSHHGWGTRIGYLELLIVLAAPSLLLHIIAMIASYSRRRLAIASAIASKVADVGAGLAALVIATVAATRNGLWTFGAFPPLILGIYLIFAGVDGVWIRRRR